MGARIGQEEQLAPIEAENFCETGDDLVGRMSLAGFEMADVRSRSLDAPGYLVLGEIELAAPLADNLTERAFLEQWHAGFFPSSLSSITGAPPDAPGNLRRNETSLFKSRARLEAEKLVLRKQLDGEICDLIRQMSMANPLWGALRIHGELLMLGIEIAESTIAKYMVTELRSTGVDRGLIDSVADDILIALTDARSLPKIPSEPEFERRREVFTCLWRIVDF